MRAVGSLYTQTNRLQDAKNTFDKALYLYRQIEDRHGEANTLSDLGNMALKQLRASEAFTLHLAALKIHRKVEDPLGTAAAHGYLGRCALAAAEPQRAVVLAARALSTLTSIESLHGQRLALDSLAQAFGVLEAPQLFDAAFLLAYDLAAEIGAPSAPARAEQLQQMLPDFEPGQRLDDETKAKLRATLTAAIAEIEKDLEEAGVDVYAPLPPDEPPADD